MGEEWVLLHSQPLSSRFRKSGLQSCEGGVILSTCQRCSGKITWGLCACKKTEEESSSQRLRCEDSHGPCRLKTRRGTNVGSFQSQKPQKAEKQTFLQTFWKECVTLKPRFWPKNHFQTSTFQNNYGINLYYFQSIGSWNFVRGEINLKSVKKELDNFFCAFLE